MSLAILNKLTNREREILKLWRYGHTALVIGKTMGITPSTVRNLMSNVYKKLGVYNRKHLNKYIEDNTPKSKVVQLKDFKQ